MTTSPKRSAIIAAYGDAWERLSESAKRDALNNDAWIQSYLMPSHVECEYDTDIGIPAEFARPLAYNNRGWTRIADDGANLPEPVLTGPLYNYCIDGVPQADHIFGHHLKVKWSAGRDGSMPNITHYQEYVLLPPPIW